MSKLHHALQLSLTQGTIRIDPIKEAPCLRFGASPYEIGVLTGGIVQEIYPCEVTGVSPLRNSCVIALSRRRNPLFGKHLRSIVRTRLEPKKRRQLRLRWPRMRSLPVKGHSRHAVSYHQERGRSHRGGPPAD